jgi:hypothetical protein
VSQQTHCGKKKNVFFPDVQEAKAARAARLAAKAATVPFRPPMLGKKSSGLGTYDGHLGPKHAHMQDYDTERIIKKKGMFPVRPRSSHHRGHPSPLTPHLTSEIAPN